jgi:hypothetical protein
VTFDSGGFATAGCGRAPPKDGAPRQTSLEVVPRRARYGAAAEQDEPTAGPRPRLTLLPSATGNSYRGTEAQGDKEGVRLLLAFVPRCLCVSVFQFQRQEAVEGRVDVLVDPGLPLLIDDAHVHAPGVQIDAAIKSVLVLK